MPDIAFNQIVTPDAVTLDWLQTPTGQLDESMALQSAVIVALGTDKLADASDDLPDLNSDDRRGWWGDDQADAIWDGWPIGSRLWLLARAKITDAAARGGATVAKVEAYIREALQPFLERKIATKMTVQVQRVGVERITAHVVLYRGPKPAIALAFQDLWTGIQA